MIFNALALLVLLALSYSVRIPMRQWWAIFGAVLAVTAWLNIFAAVNPRFLAYGPREYLRESELAHEREMAKIKTLPPATS
jgi:hypothetical protein